MPVSIREAALDDLLAILALERDEPSAAHWSADQYKTRIENGCLLVAERGNRICGFLCARVATGEWEVENVVVAADFRRQGVGIALMRALVARWQAANGSAILLEVRESNQAARALYEKCGLCETGRRRAYYNGPLEDAVLYTRQRLN